MKIESLLKRIAMAAAICGGGLFAGEPLVWERVPNRPAPAQFDTYHGEALEFRCTFEGFGALPFEGAAEAPRLYYQTNGMGAAWWSVPATVASNTLSATFPPLADPGADRMVVFFGAPSNAYAAAQVRFRNSPGATPNVLEPPSVLDWQAELAAISNALAAAYMPLTNAYTKAETDARIGELSPRISLAPATNYTDQSISGIIDGLADGEVVVDHATFADFADVAAGLQGGAGGREMSADEIFAQLAAAATTNELEAATNVVPGTISNTVTKAYVEGLGIESGIQEEGDPVWEAEKSDYATLQQMRTETSATFALFNGSNVLMVVTNYNSQVNPAMLELKQLNESNEYVTVWCETNAIQRSLDKFERDRVEPNYAPKAWSRVTSGMGVEAPSNTTWISTETTVIAGGYEPSKYMTSGGAIWLITTKGMMYDFSPSTNNVAYMNIAAQDGTPMFRIEKTDSYLVGVMVDKVTTSGNALIADFEIVAAEHPLARVCDDLRTHDWQNEEDGIPSALSTVTWTETASGWRCTMTNNTGGDALFAYFEYLQEGGTKIVNEAAMELSQGIMVEGHVYRPTPVQSGSNWYLRWDRVQ